MRKTGLVFHQDYLRHNAGMGHPERSERLESIVKHLTETKLMEKLVRIEPYSAEIDWIATIHTRGYIDSIKQACEQGYHHLDADTGICPESYQIALLATGGALSAADAVMDNKINMRAISVADTADLRTGRDRQSPVSRAAIREGFAGVL